MMFKNPLLFMELLVSVDAAMKISQPAMAFLCYCNGTSLGE